VKFKAVCTRADKLMGGVGKEDWERLEWLTVFPAENEWQRRLGKTGEGSSS
jgi:hypothetical protein